MASDPTDPLKAHPCNFPVRMGNRRTPSNSSEQLVNGLNIISFYGSQFPGSS